MSGNRTSFALAILKTAKLYIQCVFAFLQSRTVKFFESPKLYKNKEDIPVLGTGKTDFVSLKEWVKEHSPDTKNNVLYAISQDNPQVVPPEKCRYDVCFVTNEFKEDTTVFHGELPNGNYTIYTIAHTAEVVQKFYSNIGELMKQVKFDDKRPIMERYDYELVEKGKCEMCIPTE